MSSGGEGADEGDDFVVGTLPLDGESVTLPVALIEFPVALFVAFKGSCGAAGEIAVLLVVLSTGASAMGATAPFGAGMGANVEAFASGAMTGGALRLVGALVGCGVSVGSAVIKGVVGASVFCSSRWS